MNSRRTCLLHKGVFMVYFGEKEKNSVTLPNSTQSKYAFLGKIKEISKTKELTSRKKIALEILHQILDHRSTR